MPAQLIWAEEGEDLELWRVPIKSCKEQDRNAQVMPPDMLERMASTIKRDQRLESIPFAVRRDGKNGEPIFEVISGHHRIKAARMAGMTELLLLADTTDMPRSRVVAKQIAHNALVGVADPAVVVEMFEEIVSLEDALEAYAEPELLREGVGDEEVSIEPVELEEDWRTVTFAFLGEDLVSFEEVLARLTGNEYAVGAVDIKQFELFQRSVVRISNHIKVVNLGAVMVAMCKLAMKELDNHG